MHNAIAEVLGRHLADDLQKHLDALCSEDCDGHTVEQAELSMQRAISALRDFQVHHNSVEHDRRAYAEQLDQIDELLTGEPGGGNDVVGLVRDAVARAKRPEPTLRVDLLTHEDVEAIGYEAGGLNANPDDGVWVIRFCGSPVGVTDEVGTLVWSQLPQDGGWDAGEWRHALEQVAQLTSNLH